ncbi:hypothetical protein RFI_32100, partial [Reticulomyxa filosa]
SCTHLDTVHALFYRYHIGIQSRIKLCDKLVRFIIAIREGEKSALEQDKHDDLMGQLMEQVAADKKDANSRARNRISGKKESKKLTGKWPKMRRPKGRHYCRLLVNLDGLEASGVINKNYRGVNLLKDVWKLICSHSKISCAIILYGIHTLFLNTLTFIGRYTFCWEMKSDLKNTTILIGQKRVSDCGCQWDTDRGIFTAQKQPQPPKQSNSNGVLFEVFDDEFFFDVVIVDCIDK